MRLSRGARLLAAASLMVLLLPPIRAAVLRNVLNVAASRAAAGVPGDWLGPDATRPVVWSADRHAATGMVGQPTLAGHGLAWETRLGEWAAAQLPADETARPLTQLRLMAGRWQAAAAALGRGPLGAAAPRDAETAYGFQVVTGIAALDAGDVAGAIDALRRAVWLGGDRAKPDGTDALLYHALALEAAGQAALDANAWQPAYRRAKYLDLADDAAAEDALASLVGRSWTGQSPAAYADALRRLARYRAMAGDRERAIRLLQAAAAAPQAPSTVLVDLDTALRQAGRGSEAAAVAASLGQRSPEYRLGVWDGDHWTASARAVGPDWVLEGYDLDVDELADGGDVELVLYWRPAAGGERWVERRLVHNLAPNAAFSWRDAAAPGVVPGYTGGVYGEPSQAERLAADAGQPFGSNALLLDGVPGTAGSGVLSQAAVATRADGWYLEGGWRRDGGAGLLGRSCATADGGGGPQYIAYADGASQWRYFASVGPPLEGQAASYCWVFLSNASPHGEVAFAGPLLVELAPPSGAAAVVGATGSG